MNITEVTFNGAKRTTTKRLYQYDYGQILQFTDLELPEEFECDFAVDRCVNSETYLGENNQIQIPDKYLTTGNAVVGYIYLHTGEDDGETVYIFTVPVSPRPERNDPVPSTEQKSRIDTLIEQMDEAVETAETSAYSAQQSAERAEAVVEGIGDTVEQAVEDYMDTHPVVVPVDSVNGKTGAVVLDATDVGALPDTTVIPSKTSQLQNDSGYLTAIPSEYVTEQELAVETDRATSAESALSGRISTNATAIGALQRDMQTAQSDISDEVIRATQAESDIRSSIPTSAQISALAPVQSVNGQTGAVTIPAEGLSEDAKNALIDCFRHVAWIDSDGTQYVNALISALYELQSITAVYTQSGTVYDTDSLDDLKTDLVVTANYKGGTTETVTAYTLSGTLAEGTSTITVSYGGKATTFNVTVTAVALTSITATFTQGSAVIYDTASLNDLNQYLTVTARYSDGTSESVSSTDYTLSGTLEAGTSTITVSYEGMTDTFNVTVSRDSEDIDTWTDGVAYNLKWVDGYYCNGSDGKFIEYEGWSRTGYINCEGASTLDFNPLPVGGFGQSNCFYDANKSRISNFRPTNSKVTVPSNAVYFVLSSENAKVSKIVCTPNS